MTTYNQTMSGGTYACGSWLDAPLTMYSLNLGPANTGLTLSAQLIDLKGDNSGSAILSGFHEIGSGYYLWSCCLDNFQGGVKFINTANSTMMTFASVDQNNLSATGLDYISVESNINFRQAMSIISAVLGGVLSTGVGTVTINATGRTDITRVTANVSSYGDRTSVTLNIPK